MAEIKAVIFDMDGVLIDTERISFNSFKEVFKEYNYEMTEKFYLTMIGRNTKSIKELMKTEYGQDFPFDEIYEKKVNLCVSKIDREGVIVKKGVKEIIEYLSLNNYKIAVATSTRKERAHKLLEDIGIKDKLNYIICGDQVINSKPDPEIFLRAAKGLDMPVENCLVIEDSEAGVKAAMNAHIRAVNVPDMKKPDENMNKMALKVLDDLIEVREFLKSYKN